MDMKVEPKKDDKMGGYDKWEIENCADTIIKAEEIKSDAKKMKYVKPVLEKKMKGMKKAIESIDDIRAAAQEKAMDDEDYE